jgi:hypothetical protein
MIFELSVLCVEFTHVTRGYSVYFLTLDLMFRFASLETGEPCDEIAEFYAS